MVGANLPPPRSNRVKKQQFLLLIVQTSAILLSGVGQYQKAAQDATKPAHSGMARTTDSTTEFQHWGAIYQGTARTTDSTTEFQH